MMLYWGCTNVLHTYVRTHTQFISFLRNPKYHDLFVVGRGGREFLSCYFTYPRAQLHGELWGACLCEVYPLHDSTQWPCWVNIEMSSVIYTYVLYCALLSALLVQRTQTNACFEVSDVFLPTCLGCSVRWFRWAVKGSHLFPLSQESHLPWVSGLGCG